MTDTFLTDRGIIVGEALSQIGGDKLGPITDPAKIRAEWAKASPKEREQITAFALAPRNQRYTHLCLAIVTYLDTGRKFLAAAISLDGLGLPATEFHKMVGGIFPKLEPKTLVLNPPTEEEVKELGKIFDPIRPLTAGGSRRKKQPDA